MKVRSILEQRGVLVANVEPVVTEQLSEASMIPTVLGMIFDRAPDDMNAQKFGEAILVASMGLQEDRGDADDDEAFEALVGYLETAARTARALRNGG